MNLKPLKIVFIGTPEFGAVILEKLCQSDMKPILAVTAPDKPVGRKQIVTPPPVKVIAQNYGIPIIQPEKIVSLREMSQGNKNLQPDLIVVASYGQILPKEILNIPKYGCLNVHPSLLPKYRGPSPIQYAILNGEKETGITIMLMDEGVDTGSILSQRKTAIGPNETAQQLHGRLAILGAELLIDAVPDWIAGKIKIIIQEENKASYTKILNREDGKLDLKGSPEELDRKIRAFDPWPGTYSIYKKGKIKILKARLENNKLIIEKVQLEGKNPMNFQDFLRGHKDYHAN